MQVYVNIRIEYYKIIIQNTYFPKHSTTLKDGDRSQKTAQTVNEWKDAVWANISKNESMSNSECSGMINKNKSRTVRHRQKLLELTPQMKGVMKSQQYFSTGNGAYPIMSSMLS